MLAPPPADAPYHRLARTARYHWWRPLVELVLLVVCFLLFGGVATGIVQAIAGVGDSAELFELEGAWGLVAITIALAMLWPAAMLAAALAGRRPGALSSVRGRMRWGWLGRCVGAAFAVEVLYIVVAIALSAIGGTSPTGTEELSWPGWRAFLPLAAAIVLVVPLQATGEEYVFRGTLLQAIGAWIPLPWVGIALSTILFAAVHGLGVEGFVAIATMGAVMAWLTIRTGGLEAAIALHVLNNVIAFLLIAASGGSDQWISTLNAEIDWPSVVVDFGAQLVYVALVVRLANKHGVVPRSPAVSPPAAASPRPHASTAAPSAATT